MRINSNTLGMSISFFLSLLFFSLRMVGHAFNCNAQEAEKKTTIFTCMSTCLHICLSMHGCLEPMGVRTKYQILWPWSYRCL